MANLRVRTAVLALGQFVHTSLAVVLGIVLARLLTVDGWGTFQQVLLIHGLLASMLSSHIAESLLYFLPRSTHERKAHWVGQTLELSLAIGVGIGLFIYLTAGFWASRFDNPELRPLLQVFAFFPLADRILRVVPAALIAEDQAEFAAIVTVALGVARLASAIIPSAMGQPLAVVFWSMIGCWIVLAVAGLVLLLIRVGFTVSWPQPEPIREQLIYILPLLASSAVGISYHYLGHLVISFTLTERDYAEFFAGAQQLPLVGIWIASIASALLPDLVRSGEQGRHREMLDLWHRGIRKGAVLVLPAAALALVIPDHLIVMMYGPDYERGMLPFIVYLFVLPVRVTVYAVMFRALRRNRGGPRSPHHIVHPAQREPGLIAGIEPTTAQPPPVPAEFVQ